MACDRAVPVFARWCTRARRRIPFAGDAMRFSGRMCRKKRSHEKARITKGSDSHLAALEATRLPDITVRAVKDNMEECADIAASATCVRWVCVWKWGEAGRRLHVRKRRNGERYFINISIFPRDAHVHMQR